MLYRYIVVILSLFGSADAHAYLDPGTGSLLIQGLIAAIAGSLFTIRLYWQKIKDFFVRKADSDDEESDWYIFFN